jgi:uncharacterized protein
MQYQTQDVTSDDKLWALLCYIIPFWPIIVLLMEDKKNRPFLKAHYPQALALWIVELVVNIILGTIGAATLVGLICSCPVGLACLAINIYFAVKAYNGTTFEIPVITNFLKGQNWM